MAGWRKLWCHLLPAVMTLIADTCSGGRQERSQLAALDIKQILLLKDGLLRGCKLKTTDETIHRNTEAPSHSHRVQ